MVKKTLAGLSMGLFLLSGAVNAIAEDLAVEGYFTTDGPAVKAEIYANINDSHPVLSYGVKLNYDPSQMTVVSATKNEAVWYMGDGTEAGNKNYMNPDTGTAGKVIIVGGKLDTSAPLAGVTGRRVLLGKVLFSRSSTSYKPVLSLDYAKAEPYSNFVGTDGGQLDNSSSIEMSIEVKELGDANQSGSITPADINAVKANISSASYHVFMDCNCDGKLSPADINCIKLKIK